LNHIATSGLRSRNRSAAAVNGKVRASFDADFVKGLSAAIKESFDGFSIDRVVADPDLNAAFLNSCQRRGLPGTARELNRSLFRLRKAGRLAHLPATRRTSFDLETYDKFIFASEIALRRMLDDGINSLDDLLCDPEQAARFDAIAMSFAPDFSPIQYRWGALKLRKEAKRILRLIPETKSRRLTQIASVADLAVSQISNSPGLYVVCTDANEPLYAGASMELAGRLLQQFGAGEPRKAWLNLGAATVRHVRIDDAPRSPSAQFRDLLTHQSRLIAVYDHPLLNFSGFAA
jgi:site-specific DNA-methyltransferase (adenine-specific)